MPQVKEKLNTSVENIKKYFSWFNEEFSPIMKNLCLEYWNVDADVKLFSLEKNSKNFFLGNEYFVTKAQIQDIAYSLRVSDSACETFLNVALGENNQKKFTLKGMTELEGNLIFRFNNKIFKKIKEYFISKKEIQKLLDKEENFNNYLLLGFILNEKSGNYETGKIFLTVPEKLLNLPEIQIKEGKLDTSQFTKALTVVDIFVGKTKLSLDEINNIEPDDIVLLENSDIKKMSVTNPTRINFSVNPDPRLFINDDEDMMKNNNKEDITVSTKDIWDNVQVDVCAKFPKVKMSLGELREMSEGVVMELDSVYGNQVVLEVENKNVAKGELVIIGYKYGVKITEIYEQPEEVVPQVYNNSSVNADDDFDVKDFEIEE